MANFETDDDEQEADAEEAPPRRVGRPKGTPKTGGRQKGTPNYSDPAMRAELLWKSQSIEVLIDIIQGKEFLVTGPTGKPIKVRPNIDQISRALDLMLRKCLPDLQSTKAEISGPDGGPVQTEVDSRTTAKAILAVLSRAQIEQATGQPDSAAATAPAALDGGGAQPGQAVSPPTPDPDVPGDDSGHERAGNEQAPLATPGTSWREDMRSEPAPADRSHVVADEFDMRTVEQNERQLIGDAGCYIQSTGETNGDGRQYFGVFNANGQRVARILGEETARQACQQLAETGAISRSPRG